MNRVVLQIISSLKNKKKVIPLVLFLTLIATVVVVYNLPKDIDIAPDDENAAYYVTHSNIVNASPLYNKLDNSLVLFEQISEDISYFGKRAFSPYRDNTNRVVGFSVNKRKVNKKDNVVTFEGKYGSSPNLIKISAKLLANERIQTSITDTKTNLSIDSELPSNSKANQFIATLPVYKQNFNIYYSKEEEYLIRVDVGINSVAAKTEALNFIKDNTESSFVNDTNIEIYYLSISPDGERNEYIPTLISSISN